MAYTYAISDIHGKLKLFQQCLTQINLEHPENKLYLLGDFIDRGEDSLGTLQLIHQLHTEMPQQIFPLIGNHEAMLMDDLLAESIGPESCGRLYSLLSKEEACVLKSHQGTDHELLQMLIVLVRENRRDLLMWMADLPLFYETKWQIFIHAGINEVENWKDETDEYTALWTRRKTEGYFYKDVITGHTPTKMLANDPNFHKIYWDGQSHFYIDGHAYHSNILQILRFDSDSKEYSYFNEKAQKFKKLIPFSQMISQKNSDIS